MAVAPVLGPNLGSMIERFNTAPIRRANNYAPIPPDAPMKKPLPPNIFSYDDVEGVFQRHFGPSTFVFPDGSTLGDLIMLGGVDKRYKQLGYGMSGKAYQVDKGGQSFVLKHITNIEKVPLSAINHEIDMLSRVKGKWWAVQLLAAQIMPDETAFMLFPFIPGQELFDVIDYYQRHPTDQSDKAMIRYIFNTLLVGLYEMHKMGIIHRDIKPENIWIPENGEIAPFFLDFGLSVVNDGTPRYPAGTAMYSRPEHLMDTPGGLRFRHEPYIPAQNDNYYAFAKTAKLLPGILNPSISNQLAQEGVNANWVKQGLDRFGNEIYRGGSRKARRRERRKTRRQTRHVKKMIKT